MLSTSLKQAPLQGLGTNQLSWPNYLRIVSNACFPMFNGECANQVPCLFRTHEALGGVYINTITACVYIYICIYIYIYIYVCVCVGV